MPVSPTSPTRMATRGLCKNAVSAPAINPAVVVPRKADDCLRPVPRVAHLFIDTRGVDCEVFMGRGVVARNDRRDPVCVGGLGSVPWRRTAAGTAWPEVGHHQIVVKTCQLEFDSRRLHHSVARA